MRPHLLYNILNQRICLKTASSSSHSVIYRRLKCEHFFYLFPRKAYFRIDCCEKFFEFFLFFCVLEKGLARLKGEIGPSFDFLSNPFRWGVLLRRNFCDNFDQIYIDSSWFMVLLLHCFQEFWFLVQMEEIFRLLAKSYTSYWYICDIFLFQFLFTSLCFFGHFKFSNVKNIIEAKTNRPGKITKKFIILCRIFLNIWFCCFLWTKVWKSWKPVRKSRYFVFFFLS